MLKLRSPLTLSPVKIWLLAFGLTLATVAAPSGAENKKKPTPGKSKSAASAVKSKPNASKPAGAKPKPVASTAKKRAPAGSSKPKTGQVSSAPKPKPAKVEVTKRRLASPPGSPVTLEDCVNIIRRSEDRAGEQWTIFVKDIQTGEAVLGFEKDRRLIPASNRKLATYALALEKLGPEYRFKTELGLTRVIERQGRTMTASAVLRSNGDPTMDPRFLNEKNPATLLREWIRDIAELGIDRLQGDFIIDASAFGEEQNGRPLAWGRDHVNQSYAPLPSAIAINQNILRVSVAPQAKTGAAGKVQLFPSLGGLKVSNSTSTTRGTAETLGLTFDDEGHGLLVFGRVGNRHSVVEARVPIARPVSFIEGIISDELKAARLTVAGKLRILTNPEEGRQYEISRSIDQHLSPPLVDVLRIMLRESDNFIAEQLWRATAFRVSGRGDTASARKLEQDWYKEHKISWIEPGYDGSGLSRRNAVSASELVAMLEAVYRSPYRPYLIDALPASALTGTLRRRDMGLAPGRVVAKTGTLDGVSALAGFLRDSLGRERWAFAMVGNNRAGSRGALVTRQNQVIKLLAELMDANYPRLQSTTLTESQKNPAAETEVIVKGPS